MVGMLRRHVRERANGEDGIALVVAIALVAVVGMLIASMVAVTLYESRASGRDRQRSQAVMAAERAVDTLMAQIQGAAVTTLPCGTLTPQGVSVSSDTLTVSSSVQYYDEVGGQLNNCAAIRAGTTRAYTALLRASATSAPLANQAPATRAIEMLIRLEPTFANDMNKAIFGDGGIAMANHVTLYGENGQPNADVYTNESLNCDNNQEFHGSVYAQKYITMSNTCWVAVDAHAGLGFTASNSGVTINGRILVTNGNATLDKNMSVGQQVLVSGTVGNSDAFGAGRVCGTSGKCFGGQTVPAVPHQDFPIMNYTPTAVNEWIAAGYTNVVTFPRTQGGVNYQCGWMSTTSYNGKGDGVAAWLATYGATLTQDTIIYNSCTQAVSMQNNLGITINKNVVIYAKGGFTFAGNTQIKSSVSGQPHNLYLIQPYDAVSTHPCYSSGISLDNQVTITNDINVLMYSPCSIRKANNTTYFGQIYSGGKAQIDNQLTMYFKPLPIFGQSSSSTVESYSVEINYKREDA